MSRLQLWLSTSWYRGSRWLWLLVPLEWLYRGLAAARRAAYRLGLLKVYRAPLPVVVVGNLTAGGAGKTPVVIALVQALADRGLRAGVVSRGYGARGRAFPHTVTAGSHVDDCGDEPLMIHRRTGCPVVVAPSRPVAVRSLLQHFPVDLVVSDDGLQHASLGRDFEIAVVDAEAGFGNGHCLPAGPLREPAARLASVDRVLYRGGADAASAVDYLADHLVNLRTGEERAPVPASLGGGEVDALCGIGQPEQFFATLRALGFSARTRVFPDHHRYAAADLAGLGGRPLVMTEKDAVKCRELVGSEAWFLRIRARLPADLPSAVAALAAPAAGA